MKTLSLTPMDIVSATHGVLSAGVTDRAFSGISIDSRQIGINEVFVAIKGQNHDGHTFIADVLKKGIQCVVVQKAVFETLTAQAPRERSWTCIGVEDTVNALGDMARYHRKRFPIPLVAITGSNGKTSTKEMTAGILGQKFNVLATTGNFNNEIGLPLTLFKLNDTHERVVVELGMNHLGEISRLGNICLPDIGVITNIGFSHLEGLGSLDAVKQGKGELLQTLAADGTAVLNGDDPRTMELAAQTSRKVLTFGTSPDADIRARDIQLVRDAVRFTLVMPSGSIEVDLGVPGKFMVPNALAAASVAGLMGFSPEEIKAGLEAFVPVKGRLNVLYSPEGIHVIDDTYNANPSSMKAAIVTFAELKQDHRSAACLGDMLELAEFSKDLHEDIGRAVGHARPDRLFLFGEFAAQTAKGAQAAGMPSGAIFIGTQEEIMAELTAWVHSGDWILVKGSRSTHMENIVHHLMKHHQRDFKTEMD